MSMIFDNDQDHPEARCEICGGPNVNWWVDSDRWNLATTGLPRGRGSILCPPCFVGRREIFSGLHCAWTLSPTTFRPLEDAVADALADRDRQLDERTSRGEA